MSAQQKTARDRTGRSPRAKSAVPSTNRLTGRWFSTHENLAFLLVSTAWVLLLYWPVLGAPFVYDDLAQIVHNPNLAPWNLFAQRFFTSPVAFTTDFGGTGGFTYRPLYWVSIALDSRLWGSRPSGFHVTNLILHLANGWLGFRLLRRLKTPLRVASMASLMWLGLPIHAEVVAWISGRSYALCGAFLLLSLLAALAYREDGRKRHLTGFFAASLAALFSNELGVLVLPLTLLIFCSGAGLTRQRFYPLLAGSLFADAGYFAARKAVGASSSGSMAFTWSSGLAFWKYVGWMALPVHMSVERSTSTPAGSFTASALMALLSLLALCAACLLLRRKFPHASGGLAWMTLSLIPFCGLITIYQGMAERFTYIASAGLAFSLAALAFHFERPLKNLLLGCVAAWLLWGGWRLHHRAVDWSDPVALYQHSLEANPNSPSLTFNLAFSLRQIGDLQGAESAYLRTLALQRTYPHALTSLGELYLQMGDQDAAERQFVRAIGVSPNDSSAYTNLGILFSQQGHPNDAARMFAKAIANNTTDPVPYFNLAVLLQRAGHGDLALPLYKKALELKPGDRDTLENIQKLQAER